jgi:hypothetical protein
MHGSLPAGQVPSDDIRGFESGRERHPAEDRQQKNIRQQEKTTILVADLRSKFPFVPVQIGRSGGRILA